jgi:two-component system chemotaxis response regulator CheY
LVGKLDHAPERRQDGRSVQALIVDDDQAIRETLGQVLREEGFEIIEACDGGEALAQMRAATGPVLVLLDMWMPLVSGETALLAALAMPAARARLSFIVMTASPQLTSPALRATLQRLAIPLVVKPFDIDPLVELVNQCVVRFGDAAVVQRARNSGALS